MGEPKPTLMPLSVSSTFAPMKEMLTRAHELANSLAADPDLDLKPGDKARWTTHSLRRLADTIARRYREITGATEAEIDIFFGWNERVLLKAMQRHYAKLSIRERMALAKITGML